MKKPISFLFILAATVLAAGFSFTSMAAGGPKFIHDYDAAVAKGKETGKPVIVIFSASWCPPCQQMKKQVYPDRKVQPYHDSFVWAYLDADSPANEPAMRRYGTRGIPHVVFLNSNGRKISQFSGARSAEQLASLLSKIVGKKEKKGSGFFAL